MATSMQVEWNMLGSKRSSFCTFCFLSLLSPLVPLLLLFLLSIPSILSPSMYSHSICSGLFNTTDSGGECGVAHERRLVMPRPAVDQPWSVTIPHSCTYTTHKAKRLKLSDTGFVCKVHSLSDDTANRVKMSQHHNDVATHLWKLLL